MCRRSTLKLGEATPSSWLLSSLTAFVNRRYIKDIHHASAWRSCLWPCSSIDIAS